MVSSFRRESNFTIDDLTISIDCTHPCLKLAIDAHLDRKNGYHTKESS